MSGEVSCSVLEIFFEQLKREKKPPELLLKGLGLSYSDVRKRNARLDWSTFLGFMRNAEEVWPTEEQLAHIGESFFMVPAMKPFSLVARMLFDAPAFYQYVFEKQTGVGDQSFTNMEHRIEQRGARKIIMDLRIRPGYPPCDSFYVVSLGTFRGMPRALGLPPAEVVMTRVDGGARYEVTVPEGGGWLARAGRVVALPFTAVGIARELKKSMADLQRRYLELSEARAALAAQTDRLKVVNRLGRELAAHTQLYGLAEALTQLFTEEFGTLGLKVFVADEAGRQFDELCHSGQCHGVAARVLPLIAGDEQVGRLEVFLTATSDAGQLSLIDELVPWISIALGNARSFTLLREYRDQLSQKVEARTRELNEAMKQLAESLEQQREAIRVKTEFFDNVSHELRTPLTLILLTVESLQQQGPDVVTPKVRQHLDGMQRSSARLLRLINDLLDLAKLGAGKMRVHYDPIEIHDFVSALLVPFRVMAEKRGITLTFESEAVPGDTIYADSEKLDVVLQNLVSNALKFTSKGGVTVKLARSSDHVEIEVRDTGVGISASDLPHIFNRFAQADERGTRRFGGTGIGLALVKELVELHGGTVHVESTEGEGSLFRISLPRGTAHIREDLRERRAVNLPVRFDRRGDGSASRALEPERGSSTRIMPLPAVTTTDDAARPLVLIVEDDAEIRAFLNVILTAHYRVAEASNGEEGLALAQSLQPSLIVSDVMMPVMSGLQLLAALRKNPATAEVPVILLTARHDVDARVGGLSDGANDYIGKPFAPRELIARIETQLRLREASARVAQAERLAAMSLLTSGFAHEVRNPLNGLMNAIDPLRAALDKPEDKPIAASMLDVIEESCTRIRFLAESLLSMARTTRGQDQVRIADSLRSAERALAWKTRPGMTIVHDVEDDVIAIGDASALSQVWVNLLDNALRAIGEAGTITLTARRVDSEVHVAVADSGPGIDGATLRRLFEPFFSTRAPGEGTGLGLALCRRIVEQHAGRIDVESEPGKGTRVTVRLPAAPAYTHPHAPTPAPRPAVQTSTNGRDSG